MHHCVGLITTASRSHLGGGIGFLIYVVCNSEVRGVVRKPTGINAENRVLEKGGEIIYPEECQ